MINCYKINDSKFKSIYLSVNFTMDLDKEGISKNALLASVLSKASSKFSNQQEIEKYLDKLYGSSFDVNVEKFGDLYNVEFCIECVNKEYLPNKEDVVIPCLEFLHSIIYAPNINNNCFDEDIVKREKESLLDKIRAKKDDKLKYGVIKTEEIMTYPDKFSVFLYGDEDVVKNTTSFDLYTTYNQMLNNSCISIIVSGNLSGYDDIEDTVNRIFKYANSALKYQDLKYDNHVAGTTNNKIQEVREASDTNQSVITFGLRVNNVNEEDFFVLNVYNAVLGATPSSKLFQNFRERESLAYTVRSRYYRFKSIIIIYAGIEEKNYDRAKEVIMNQLNDMKNANISEIEFNASKNSIISDLSEWKDSKIAMSKMLLSNLIVYKQNNMSIEDMIEKIKGVTLDDVINVANKIDIEKIFLLGGESNE